MIRRALPASLLFLAVPFASCDNGDDLMLVPEFEQSFDFESGLGGWAGHADDLPVGSAWTVDVSSGEAAEGQAAARLDLAIVEPRGRVWMDRAFDVTAGQSYEVTVTFALGTADDAATTGWDVLAGGGPTEPTPGSLTVRGSTTPDSPGTGMVWEERSFTFQATAGPATGGDETGRIWIALGIAPTTAEHREYGIDDVRLSFLRNR